MKAVPCPSGFPGLSPHRSRAATGLHQEDGTRSWPSILRSLARRRVLPAGAILALAISTAAQTEEIGQEGAVWNLGELSPGSYPTTVTAMNLSCRGRHDFEILVEGQAARFLFITGPRILKDIPRQQGKTTEAVVDLREIPPGVYNEGILRIRCLDCPPSCRLDYQIIAIHLTVVGAAAGPQHREPAATSNDTTDTSLWHEIDLTRKPSARHPNAN